MVEHNWVRKRDQILPRLSPSSVIDIQWVGLGLEIYSDDKYVQHLPRLFLFVAVKLAILISLHFWVQRQF